MEYNIPTSYCNSAVMIPISTHSYHIAAERIFRGKGEKSVSTVNTHLHALIFIYQMPCNTGAERSSYQRKDGTAPKTDATLSNTWEKEITFNSYSIKGSNPKHLGIS